MQQTQVKELEIAKQQALSFQGSTSHMKCIGATESKEGRINMFFKDSNGMYWFTTHYRVGDRILSEEEYIFGRKLPRNKWNRYKK